MNNAFKIFLTLTLIFTNYFSFSQFFVKNKIQKTFIAGFHTSGQGYNYKDPNTNEKIYLSDISIDPYLGYFFNGGFGVGITADFEFIRSNVVPNQTLYGVGLFARYYLPFIMDKKFLNRFLFFGEVMYRRTNYAVLFSSRNEFILSDHLEYNIITFNLGPQIRILKGLYVEITAQYTIFIEGTDFFTGRLGFEYHFNKKKND
jgi:hypothetical protein